MEDDGLLQYLRGMVDHVIRASDLYQRTRSVLERDKPDIRIVIAFGKASVPMAKAAVEVLGDRVEGGVVVIPRWREPVKLGNLEVIQANHPVPDEGSLEAGEAVIEWSRAASGKGLLVLVSGGGSALVEKPQEGLTLEDLTRTTKLLLNSGANIHEINTVRKHLSMVKGGWLAKHAEPGPVYAYYASDVPGDRFESIASGPTAPDPTTYSDALLVLKRYELLGKVPMSVIKVLEEGASGRRPETPKPDDPVFRNVSNKLVAANIDVLIGLQNVLEEDGFNTLILTSRLDGDSREVGKALASITLEILERGVPIRPPAALLLGGETSVKVKNPEGRGGRNQELALSWLLHVDKWLTDYGRVGLLAMDTDGIDGNSPAAGAIVVSGMSKLARDKGFDPYLYLEENNSYELLRAIGSTIETGGLDSNLNSVVIILIKKI
ncbi:MAG: glycerate kinase [Desulfurococcales archaeon]|nr:glycerate kinase [Desulfurococcales archaeon]